MRLHGLKPCSICFTGKNGCEIPVATFFVQHVMRVDVPQKQSADRCMRTADRETVERGSEDRGKSV